MEQVFIPKDLCANCFEKEAKSTDEPWCGPRCEQEFYEKWERSETDGPHVSAT